MNNKQGANMLIYFLNNRFFDSIDKNFWFYRHRQIWVMKEKQLCKTNLPILQI